MNKKKLEYYSQYLPKDIVAEAADIAAAEDSARRRTNSSGRKNPALRVLKYAAVAVIAVASFAAGIIISVKVRGKQARGNESTAILETAGIPENTDNIDARPTDMPTKEPTAKELEYMPPEGSTEYKIVIDSSMQEEYPDNYPKTVSIAPDGTAYFTIMLDITPSQTFFINNEKGLYEGEYTASGSVTAILRHRLTVTEDEGVIRLETSDILITADCLKEDRELFLRYLDQQPESGTDKQNKIQPLYDLLGDGLVYRYAAGTWSTRIQFYARDTVNALSFKIAGNNGPDGGNSFMLVSLETSPAGATKQDIKIYSWDYDVIGKLSYSSSIIKGNSTEKYLENGVLKREVSYDNSEKMYRDRSYGDGATVIHMYSEDGRFDSITEMYTDRSDLLCQTLKSEEAVGDGKRYESSEWYYTDSSMTASYNRKTYSRIEMNDGSWESWVSENNENDAPVYSLYENSSGIRESERIEYSNSGEEVYHKDNVLGLDIVRYQYYKYGSEGQILYYERKIPATGEFDQFEYDSTHMTVRRIYEPDLEGGNPKHCATYFDGQNKVTKVVPITFENGKWYEDGEPLALIDWKE